MVFDTAPVDSNFDLRIRNMVNSPREQPRGEAGVFGKIFKTRALSLLSPAESHRDS
ncbi:MAG: hypothetical protein M2R45_04991 [Verrucomicrobia subdivision 3 bacterium]|nr:hypothetical protein [Limisphaerales bacterium]MCS1415588.1 hypothetical protein [Limisphaerales bacterium]